MTSIAWHVRLKKYLVPLPQHQFHSLKKLHKKSKQSNGDRPQKSKSTSKKSSRDHDSDYEYKEKSLVLKAKRKLISSDDEESLRKEKKKKISQKTDMTTTSYSSAAPNHTSTTLPVTSGSSSSDVVNISEKVVKSEVDIKPEVMERRQSPTPSRNPSNIESVIKTEVKQEQASVCEPSPAKRESSIPESSRMDVDPSE